MLREGGECWLDASTFIAFKRRLQQPLAACAQSYIPVRVACWKCDSVSLPGWQLEVLVPPAGVQKVNVCFTCFSLCSYELDTISSNTAPLVWAESPWIAGKSRTSVGGFLANQASTGSRSNKCSSGLAKRGCGGVCPAWRNTRVQGVPRQKKREKSNRGGG